MLLFMESYKQQWAKDFYIPTEGRVTLYERFRKKLLPQLAVKLENILTAMNRSVIEQKMIDDLMVISSGVDMLLLGMSPENPTRIDAVELKQFILQVESCLVIHGQHDF